FGQLTGDNGVQVSHENGRITIAHQDTSDWPSMTFDDETWVRGLLLDGQGHLNTIITGPPQLVPLSGSPRIRGTLDISQTLSGSGRVYQQVVVPRVSAQVFQGAGTYLTGISPAQLVGTMPVSSGGIGSVTPGPGLIMVSQNQWVRLAMMPDQVVISSTNATLDTPRTLTPGPGLQFDTGDSLTLRHVTGPLESAYRGSIESIVLTPEGQVMSIGTSQFLSELVPLGQVTTINTLLRVGQIWTPTFSVLDGSLTMGPIKLDGQLTRIGIGRIPQEALDVLGGVMISGDMAANQFDASQLTVRRQAIMAPGVKVGVGKPPTELLDVNGSASVSTLRSRTIQVSEQVNTNRLLSAEMLRASSLTSGGLSGNRLVVITANVTDSMRVLGDTKGGGIETAFLSVPRVNQLVVTQSGMMEWAQLPYVTVPIMATMNQLGVTALDVPTATVAQLAVRVGTFNQLTAVDMGVPGQMRAPGLMVQQINGLGVATLSRMVVETTASLNQLVVPTHATVGTLGSEALTGKGSMTVSTVSVMQAATINAVRVGALLTVEGSATINRLEGVTELSVNQLNIGQYTGTELSAESIEIREWLRLNADAVFNRMLVPTASIASLNVGNFDGKGWNRIALMGVNAATINRVMVDELGGWKKTEARDMTVSRSLMVEDTATLIQGMVADRAAVGRVSVPESVMVSGYSTINQLVIQDGIIQQLISQRAMIQQVTANEMVITGDMLIDAGAWAMIPDITVPITGTINQMVVTRSLGVAGDARMNRLMVQTGTANALAVQNRLAVSQIASVNQLVVTGGMIVVTDQDAIMQHVVVPIDGRLNQLVVTRSMGVPTIASVNNLSARMVSINQGTVNRLTGLAQTTANGVILQTLQMPQSGARMTDVTVKVGSSMQQAVVTTAIVETAQFTQLIATLATINTLDVTDQLRVMGVASFNAMVVTRSLEVAGDTQLQGVVIPGELAARQVAADRVVVQADAAIGQLTGSMATINALDVTEEL
ncbi:hypothetical protein EBZ35_06625, partial [bacterium]|nr:hypothetical protein [bacterium]